MSLANKTGHSCPVCRARLWGSNALAKHMADYHGIAPRQPQPEPDVGCRTVVDFRPASMRGTT